MDPTHHAAEEEKSRLQRYLQLHEQSPLPPPSRSSASGSNTVPMTEEELDSSFPVDSTPIPLHTYTIPRVPVPAPAANPIQAAPRSPTPPPYSGPTSPAHEPPQAPEDALSSGSRPPPRYPGLPALDYRLYKPPLFELSSDKTTLRTSAPHFSADAAALVALIRQQATVPPKPQIHITGRRGGSATSGRVDFAIKLNLLPLLVPEDPRQRMDYLRCVGPGEVALRGGTKPAAQPDDVEGLEGWAARFVADTAAVRAFALERVVVNLDQHWLEGQIRALVAGLRYPGTVTVAFPVTHARVVVQSPDRVNKFITSVTGFFAGKRRYEVVKAVWPFATMPRGAEAGGERRCAVQSEETWWREWRDPIRYAIATKRHGWVTNEDKLEVLMEAMPANMPVNVDWGPDGSV
ncbi:uncharacterized protein THITE_2115606 [Thermothielavioides terrestris NRRL 8126]|uniref:Uncharacterized protein n=1 Tax=Thermothielavioides terrestris (strain ATCC 38088 / NRRL 8126) TaxID=578455 RepID=G2R4Y9_THETT|nr:uncharacterized protein THITE_2115606 [Thermothielavioides terrestris NRRL 8126]AEO66974.1 hypothetical protein THITE_2115606 [Thermothielavioides terrestris NRRL 8126]